MKSIEFRCDKCGKYTTRNIGRLRPGQIVRCKHCGNQLYKKPDFIKPPKLPDLREYDLTGQPIEYLTCDRCGEKFLKRLAVYRLGVVFCPSCNEQYEIMTSEPELSPRKYSSM